MLGRNLVRVGPSESTGEIVEIRPTRRLRIQHFNLRPRDDKFEKEMQIYSQSKPKGYITSGPLTVPNRDSASQKSSKHIADNLKKLELEIRQVKHRTKSTDDELKNVKDVCYLSRYEKISSSTLSSKVDDNEQFLNKSQKSLIEQEAKNNASPKTNNHSDFSFTSLPSPSEHTDVLKPHENKQSLPSSQNTINKDLALFFIHGVGSSSDIWQSQTQYFSSLGYEIICPDLIGHGLSCAPKHSKAYHFTEIAYDLEAIFDKYCKRKNIIIGHSYGASFASYLARRRPKRVMKLILISGGPPTPLAPQSGVFKLPYFMLVCIKPCLVLGFHKGAFKKTKVPVMNKREAFNIPAYVLQHVMNGQDWPDGDELFHNWLTCPCLLIYGAEDRLVSLSDEQQMAQVIFDSHLEVIKDASHMVMVEAPEEVNKMIETFIMKPLDNNSS